MQHLLLTEIIYSKLMIREGFSQELEMFLNSNKSTNTDHKQTIEMSVSGAKLAQEGGNIFSDITEETVIIVPIIGTMFKYDNWWNYGCDYYANLIRQANESENVYGIIILMNTPGGSVQSLIQLEDAIRNSVKPIVTVVDGMCCSCGYYIASLTDKVVAMHRMCEIGSIGVMARFQDPTKMYEDAGVKIYEVYPPESNYKNKDTRDLFAKGDSKWLIDESLSPWAKHFQNIVKENRNIDENIEGIINGRVFYAYDAQENGMIDGIMNMDQAVGLVKDLISEKKTMASLFK